MGNTLNMTAATRGGGRRILVARSVMLWLALLLAGCASEWERQVAAVREGRADRIELTGEVIDDGQLAQVVALISLRALILDETTITDRGLSALTQLEQLEHLRLRGARITDAGLVRVAAARRLRVLNLPQADLTDQGLASLSEFPDLELVRIGSPRVTDKGLEHLARLPSLKFLHLIDVPVTDLGLEHLHAAQHLQSFYVDGSQVTDEGIGRLLAALPGLHIHIDQRHSDRDPRARDHAH